MEESLRSLKGKLLYLDHKLNLIEEWMRSRSFSFIFYDRGATIFAGPLLLLLVAAVPDASTTTATAGSIWLLSTAAAVLDPIVAAVAVSDSVIQPQLYATPPCSSSPPDYTTPRYHQPLQISPPQQYKFSPYVFDEMAMRKEVRVEESHKEPETKICANMLDSLNECVQLSGPLLDGREDEVEKKKSIVSMGDKNGPMSDAETEGNDSSDAIDDDTGDQILKGIRTSLPRRRPSRFGSLI